MCNKKSIGQEINRVEMIMPAKSCNERIARMFVSMLSTQLDPTVNEMSDLITAVSEAVTNSIIHAYAGREDRDKCIIKIECFIYKDGIKAIITDYGKGIEDIEKAKTLLYTTSYDTERAGMGFTIMKSFCDEFSVESEVGKGTVVSLLKIFGGDNLCEDTTTLQ